MDSLWADASEKRRSVFFRPLPKPSIALASTSSGQSVVPPRSTPPISDKRPIVRCSVGHSYMTSESKQCPFCEDFLSEFRDIASQRAASLLSTSQSRLLRFFCKRHSETFAVHVGEARRGDHWCKKCKSIPTPRELPRRVLDPRKEQADLLASARRKMNSSQKKDIDLDELARKDKSRDISHKQLMVVIAAAFEGDTYWELLEKALGTVDANIDQLYRMAARHVHPDKCNHPKAADAFKNLSKQFALTKSSK